MQDRDLTTAGVVLIRSGLTIAGTIPGEIHPGVRIALVPLRLLVTAVLVVLSVAHFVISIPENPRESKKGLLCRTIP